MSDYTPLQSTKKYEAELEKNIQNAWEAHFSKRQKVCYTPSSFPRHILNAFDIQVLYGELESGIAAKMGMTPKWSSVAESAGYSRDLCTFVRVNMGKALAGAGPEDVGYPPPDFLLTIKTLCTQYVNWFETLARHYHVPIFVHGVPWWDKSFDEPVAEHHTKYYIERSRDLIAFLEEQTGQKFDEDRFRAAIQQEIEVNKLTGEIRSLLKRVPCPVSEFELNGIVPGLLYRGQPWALDCLREVKAEIEERIAHGITGIPNEKHRILYLSVAPEWLVSEFQQWLAERDAIIVKGDLVSQFEDLSAMTGLTLEHTLDPCVKRSISMGFEERFRLAERTIKEWKCDGVIFMDHVTCKMIAAPVSSLIKMIEERLHIPCMRFEGDIADPRNLDLEKVKDQFNSFIDLLEQSGE